jgi:RNA polymerase sigma-70 factor (ECF subfamily)
VASFGSADRHSVDARTLYQGYGDRLHAFCLARLSDREEAADVVQDTFLNAWLALTRGFEPEAPYAWLLTIAHNLCVSRYRARGARVQASPLEEEHEQLAARQRSSDELMELEPLLRRLPEQQRRAFLLYEIQGLSHTEVAAKLGLSYAAAATLVFRARKALAEGLAGRTGGEPPARAPSWGPLLGMLEPLFGGGAPAKVALLASIAPLALLPSSGVLHPSARASRPAHVSAIGPAPASPALAVALPAEAAADEASHHGITRTELPTTPIAGPGGPRPGGDESAAGSAPMAAQTQSHAPASEGPGDVQPPSAPAPASSRSAPTPSPAGEETTAVAVVEAGGTGDGGRRPAAALTAGPGAQGQGNGPPADPGSQSQGNGPPADPGSQSQGNGPPADPGSQSQGNGPPTNPGSQTEGGGSSANPGNPSPGQSTPPPAEAGGRSPGNGRP